MKTSLSCILILAGLCLTDAPASAQTAAQLTGTYTRIKRYNGENQSAILEIKQISGSKIKFDLTALWWPVGRGDSPHNGEVEATVMLHKHVAVYESGEYRLTLRFQDRRVVLTERGSNPDFGVNVNASGTYRRTRRG